MEPIEMDMGDFLHPHIMTNLNDRDEHGIGIMADATRI